MTIGVNGVEGDGRGATTGYDAWVAVKVLRSRAEMFLRNIDGPGSDSGRSDSQRMSHWQRVGRALKQVDRSLFQAWAAWSRPFQPTNACLREWETYPPISCALHEIASDERDVMIRLLHRHSQVSFKLQFEEDILKKKRIFRRELNDGDMAGYLEDTKFTPDSFKKILLDSGVTIHNHALKTIMKAFDRNNDGTVTAGEFLSFLGPRESTDVEGRLLRCACIWDAEGEGDEDGSEGGGRGSRRGSKKKGSRLVDVAADVHAEDEYGNTTGSESEGGGGGGGRRGRKAKRCDVPQWSVDRREDGLDVLEQLSQRRRDQEQELKLLSQGEPPAKPQFDVKRRAGDSEEARTTSLRLVWKPVPGTPLPTFFILESGGEETGRPITKFIEIAKDPPGPEQEGRFKFTVPGLRPSTRYHFRLTAFNGFGASAPVYRAFTTVPKQPPPPVVLRSAVVNGKASLTIGWNLGAEFQRKLSELQTVFEQGDENGNGTLDRGEFDQMVLGVPRLRDFLSWVQADAGMNAGSVYDDIESNEDGSISWDEFRSYFIERGAAMDVAVGGGGGGGGGDDDGLVPVMDDEMTGLKSRRAAATDADAKLRAAAMREKRAASKCARDRFTLYRKRAPGGGGPLAALVASSGGDESKQRGGVGGEEGSLDVFEEVYTGCETQFVVKDLPAGQCVQFCVKAVNDDGEASMPSRLVLVNTLMDRPAAPRLSGPEGSNSFTAGRPNELQLNWAEYISPATQVRSTDAPVVGAASLATSLRRSRGDPLAAEGKDAPLTDTRAQRRMFEVEAWANDGLAAQSNVGVDTMHDTFDRFDRDRNGTIDKSELGELLKEFGSPCDADSVASLLEALDADRSGSVSFEEFAQWYDQHEVTYVVKRDAGTPGTTIYDVLGIPPPAGDPAIADAGGTVATMKKAGGFVTTVYRGSSRRCDMADLLPNTMYRFVIRHLSHRSSSPLSRSLMVMTPPEPPTEPIVIAVTDRRVTLKWYPGRGGAHRYVVYAAPVGQALSEQRLNSSSSSSSRSGRGAKGGKGGKGSGSGRGSGPQWSKVYEGAENVCILDRLDAGTVYQFCAVALNRAMWEKEVRTRVEMKEVSKKEQGTKQSRFFSRTQAMTTSSMQASATKMKVKAFAGASCGVSEFSLPVELETLRPDQAVPVTPKTASTIFTCELEYADEVTLGRSIMTRSKVNTD